MIQSKTKRITATAFFIALGILLPSAFHLVGKAGSVFLPMHIPVLLCGFLCSASYGALCGVLVPLLSSLITGMPPIFPIGISMMLELASYGFLAGVCYEKFGRRIYPALITSMIGGRIVCGIANAFLFNMAGKAYGFQAFVSGAFVVALPGIVIQLILLPLLIISLKKVLRSESNIK